ncbi:MAG TPA: hypothetical protein VNJ02_01485 [Vicinamibacterales bacterium]|nr:hypothetical protein [Vicinamibacterales bacterium]
MHVGYGCRDAGACCSSGWPIPLEASRVSAIRGLKGDDGWLMQASGAPAEFAGVLATNDQRCIFHGDARCDIHQALGPDALPSACQHFPRECLIDRRGVFVTLSHYCPTAAEMLFAHRGPVAVVEGPSVAGGRPEGLDARDALPPSLTERVLMDDDSYAAWEQHAVRILTASHLGPEAALAGLARQSEQVAQWRPGDGSLTTVITALPTPEALAAIDWVAEARRFEAARAALAPGHTWPDYPANATAEWDGWLAASWRGHRDVINRFLAAHAFASWAAYQGHGLRSTVAKLHTTLAVLRAELIRGAGHRASASPRGALMHAIRQTDLLLIHLTERDALARAWSS